MRFWSMLFFTSFLSPVNAKMGVPEIMDVSDTKKSPAAIAGIIPSMRSDNDKSTAVPLGEGAIPSMREMYDKTSSVSLIAAERSKTPAANTPGGGVPRLREELRPSPPEELPWWEKWWEAVVAFFCETKETSQ